MNQIKANYPIVHFILDSEDESLGEIGEQVALSLPMNLSHQLLPGHSVGILGVNRANTLSQLSVKDKKRRLCWHALVEHSLIDADCACLESLPGVKFLRKLIMLRTVS